MAELIASIAGVGLPPLGGLAAVTSSAALIGDSAPPTVASWLGGGDSNRSFGVFGVFGLDSSEMLAPRG